MHTTKISVLLLAGVSSSLALLENAPQHENGEAVIVNKCSIPVFYASIGDSGSMNTLPPGGIYREQFKLRYVGEDSAGSAKYGGISIKLSPNQSIAQATNNQEAFSQSTITQFEYTYNPLIPPGLWYDISNVNGYVWDTDNGWNGVLPWPFQEQGLILEGTSNECTPVICPGGNPHGNSSCVQAYTHSEDNWATHGCRNNNSVVLTLCTEVSSLMDIINTENISNEAEGFHGCL